MVPSCMRIAGIGVKRGGTALLPCGRMGREKCARRLRRWPSLFIHPPTTGVWRAPEVWRAEARHSCRAGEWDENTRDCCGTGLRFSFTPPPQECGGLRRCGGRRHGTPAVRANGTRIRETFAALAFACHSPPRHRSVAGSGGVAGSVRAVFLLLEIRVCVSLRTCRSVSP